MLYRQQTTHVESEESVLRRRRARFVLQVALLLAFVLAMVKLSSGPMPWGKAVSQRVADKAPEVASVKDVSSFGHWLHSEIDHPKLLRAKEHAIIGTWYACTIVAGAAFVLLLTLPAWMPRGERDAGSEADENSGDADAESGEGLSGLLGAGPVFYILVIGAMAAGLWFRAPCMGHSLWNDEEYAMRRFALGGMENGKFEPVTWTDTLYENHNGNNHLLHSALSRVSLNVWRMFHRDAAPGAFSETAVRMPSLIAAVLTILLVAVIGWEMGMPWLGISAAWLLALHPWHIRYSAEGKGYALCIFFVCLAVLGLIRALRRNSLGDWLLFGLGEAGFLLSFAGSLYVAVALNVIACFECLRRRRGRQVATLLAVNAIAAMPVILWTMPSVPQLIGFIQNDNSPRLEANAGWVTDLGSHVLTGFQFNNAEPETHCGTSWKLLQESHPQVMTLFFWGALMLAGGGILVATFDSMAGRVALLGPLLAGLLSFWHAHVQHHPNLAMYYIYVLVSLVLGAGYLLLRFRRVPGYLVLLIVAGFGVATQVPRGIFIEHGRQPIRSVVQAIREKRPNALTGTYGVSARQVESYDPNVRQLAQPADVDKLLREGAAKGVPVFVFVAGATESAKREPELTARVTKSPDFARWRQFPGHEAMWSYTIYGPPGLK